MAGVVDNFTRDQLMSAFRDRICERMDIVPLIHQRRWWCAMEGRLLVEGIEDTENGVLVKLPDESIAKWATVPRAGGVARVVADLGAFKSGKSFGSALWLAGLAAVPGAQASLVGIEYDTVSPEFNYLVEFLLSGRGMGMKYKSLQNRPRDGKMWLEFDNGVTFDAKSWERKDTLKGKEKDAYLYCEAYQLPGLECYSSVKQNLVARDGMAVFPTTPDRPWVKEFHVHGHGDPSFPQWECICGIPRQQNYYTYSQKEELEDKQLLTSEKFAIAHFGQLGDFVGRVFAYNRGERVFSSATHPDLFRPGGSSREHLVVPANWEIVSGADTGTYYSALTVAFDPDGNAFVIDEFPNYRYVGGSPERDESISIPQWARHVERSINALHGRAILWADPNSQFKAELRNYGLSLLPQRSPVEARTEITREFFEHKRIWIAPWISVLPFELENAAWPEEASASGKFSRVKDRDHTLDCLEHILSRRPSGRAAKSSKVYGSWAAANFKARRPNRNVHLGRN